MSHAILSLMVISIISFLITHFKLFYYVIICTSTHTIRSPHITYLGVMTTTLSIGCLFFSKNYYYYRHDSKILRMSLVILRYCQNIEVSHYFEILCLIFEQLSQNIEILYHYFQILSHYFEDSRYNDLQLLFFSPSSFAAVYI